MFFQGALLARVHGSILFVLVGSIVQLSLLPSSPRPLSFSIQFLRLLPALVSVGLLPLVSRWTRFSPEIVFFFVIASWQVANCLSMNDFILSSSNIAAYISFSPSFSSDFAVSLVFFFFFFCSSLRPLTLLTVPGWPVPRARRKALFAQTNERSWRIKN